MKKRMKYFQEEEFDLDGAGPAQPSGGPPYIRWPFRWACCIYLTFICHVFNFFVVDIFAVFCPYRHFDEGLHLLNVCLIFLTHFIFLLSYLNFVPSMVKQSLEVSRNNPWVINIQLQSSCAMKKWLLRDETKKHRERNNDEGKPKQTARKPKSLTNYVEHLQAINR